MTFDEEKKKVWLEHWLQICRSFIDKLLLGVLLAAIAFIGNMLLEQHKSSLIQQQFLLESRLEGLKAIREAYSKVANKMTALSATDEPVTSKDLNSYKKAVLEFAHTANEYGALFSKHFDRQIQYYTWIHETCALGEVQLSGDHYDFSTDLADSFGDLTRKALWEETLGLSARKMESRFQFIEWDYSMMKDRGGPEYFRVNFEKWRKQRKPLKTLDH